jgi:flagellar biosynthetic protein FlhB
MRQIQRDLSRQRMIAEVAKADVVVTNPSHYAVALRYAAGEMSAPQVLAKGRNHVALRIRETARQHGVPVFENPPLARLLYRTARVGQEVPASLYRAVAEVLAYVYRLDARRAAAWRGSS